MEPFSTHPPSEVWAGAHTLLHSVSSWHVDTNTSQTCKFRLLPPLSVTLLRLRVHRVVFTKQQLLHITCQSNNVGVSTAFHSVSTHTRTHTHVLMNLWGEHLNQMSLLTSLTGFLLQPATRGQSFYSVSCQPSFLNFSLISNTEALNWWRISVSIWDTEHGGIRLRLKMDLVTWGRCHSCSR